MVFALIREKEESTNNIHVSGGICNHPCHCLWKSYTTTTPSIPAPLGLKSNITKSHRCPWQILIPLRKRGTLILPLLTSCNPPSGASNTIKWRVKTRSCTATLMELTCWRDRRTCLRMSLIWKACCVGIQQCPADPRCWSPSPGISGVQNDSLIHTNGTNLASSPEKYTSDRVRRLDELIRGGRRRGLYTPEHVTSSRGVLSC